MSIHLNEDLPNEEAALHGVHYREYKILLNSDCFRTAQGFADYWSDVKKTASNLGVDVNDGAGHAEHQIRDVTFYDTEDFGLYKSAFIFRKRRILENGFPQPNCEITLKFRHPNPAAAGAVDISPQGRVSKSCQWVQKFKEEIIPISGHPGAFNSVFSHNAVLNIERIPFDKTIGHLQKTFPATEAANIDPSFPLTVVNDVVAEEVQAILGHFHFGNHYNAKADIAIWRNRATREPISGEFAFQCKFRHYLGIHKKAKHLSESFYRQLQLDTINWLQTGSTKTRMIYESGGKHIDAHE